MPIVRLTAALFASALTAVACSKTSMAPVSVDGGVEAQAPLAYAGPFEAHVVARSLAWRTRIVARQNGVPVLDAGLFRYQLTADGRVERIGDDASYVKQMPPDDDSLGGYDVLPRPDGFAPATASEGAYEWPDVRGPSDNRLGNNAQEDIDAPAGIVVGDFRRSAAGTGILLATEPGGTAPVSVVAARGSRAGTLVRFPDLEPASASGTRCEHVPSWQKPHVFCVSRSNALTSVYRLVGDHWERVRISEELSHERLTGAVGHDGALWLGVRNGVVRVATDGASETITLPTADAKLARAHYSSSEAYGRSAVAQTDDAAAQARRFERLYVAPAVPPHAYDRIEQIVPRKDGEAWVTAVDGSALVIVHLSRPAIAPLPDALTIGTETDQRNEIRNTRPPIVWVGHCAQLFVALAKQRADGSFASENVWSRETMIAAAMKKSLGKVLARTAMPSGALVEGRLGGRRVAGVLVWRGSPAVSEELLENTVKALAEELTSVTGLPPDITCSAPVLERASKL